MHLTNQQRKGLVFLAGIILISLVYSYIHYQITRTTPYDFSRFEKQFLARRDSIEQLLLADSLEKAASSEREAQSQSTVGSTIFPININTADAATLTRLPRIGPKTAAKIIAYRQEHGRFATKEELMNVSGIGPKTFANLKDLIVVE